MILTFSSLKVKAAVLSDSEVKTFIVKQVGENYKKYTDAQLDIEVVALPFKDLCLPDGEVSFLVIPSMDKFMPRDLEKVSVYVNDKVVKTFNVPIVVKAYENVLVASCFINREEQINSNVVTVKKMEISNTSQYPLRADALGKDILAKKAFREGEIIDKRFVKLRPDVLRNSNVTVFFNTNNLTVSTEATALSDGIIGDNICLMNRNYNRTYRGKVIGENKVLVKI
jgi:flagella basal body P-ring formation protein FlgA